jgi:hypothetical protein
MLQEGRPLYQGEIDFQERRFDTADEKKKVS